MRKRIEVHKQKMTPLLEYYRKKGILAEIDANMDINNPKAHIIQDTVAEIEKIEG